MFWVGEAGGLQVRFSVAFENNDLHTTISVVLRNIGSQRLTDVYYMRTIDPDQVRVLRNRLREPVTTTDHKLCARIRNTTIPATSTRTIG